MVAGVIGWPVAHSRSPAIHAAAAAATGVSLAYGTFPVRAGDVERALDGVRALGIRGLSVTMPHKEAVLAGMDTLSETARALEAVNCITNTDGELHGDNTDGAGFLHGLGEAAAFDVAGRHVGVLGAGGAARAIIHACTAGGAESVTVINRSADRAQRAVALAEDRGRVGDADSLSHLDLLVNATSVGMAGTTAADTAPCSLDSLPGHALVVDIVYTPVQTQLLKSAAQRGLHAVGGLPMLVGQAALQFQQWTGEVPAFGPLLDAAAIQVSGQN
jgi:shikimate dehydrogenase